MNRAPWEDYDNWLAELDADMGVLLACVAAALILALLGVCNMLPGAGA